MRARGFDCRRRQTAVPASTALAASAALDSAACRQHTRARAVRGTDRDWVGGSGRSKARGGRAREGRHAGSIAAAARPKRRRRLRFQKRLHSTRPHQALLLMLL